MYYAFLSAKTFIRLSSKEKWWAKQLSCDKRYLVFEHVKEIPNPWFVRIMKNGRVIDKVLKPSQQSKKRKSYFKKQKELYV